MKRATEIHWGDLAINPRQCLTEPGVAFNFSYAPLYAVTIEMNHAANYGYYRYYRPLFGVMDGKWPAGSA